MVAMGMLVNPVTYLGAEYVEVYQKIKTRIGKGYTSKEIIDEVLSGFQAPVYSADQILFSNAFEQNVQKQRFVIKRNYLDYTEAQAKYGEHENWDYVQPGITSVLGNADGLFYDVKDDDHPFLVEEVTYLNRREDTEVCFLGGIYTGSPNVEENPIRHRDSRNAPKYNITPYGYQRINEHFFFYKSLMNAQYWDNLLLDSQYELGMNRAFLDTEMPIAVSGVDKIDSDIIFPRSVVAFSDKDTKVSPLLPQANLGQMFQAMGVVESSMEESSVSGVTAGQLPDSAQKATSVAIAQRNAQTLLQGVGKTLAESTVQYGQLMSDIAINNLTVPQAEEILGKESKLKYRSFILNNKVVDGKESNKVLQFDESLLGLEITDDEKRGKNLELLKEVGYPNIKSHLYKINPEIFHRRRYLCRVEPERMFPKNEEFIQAMAVQFYQLLRGDPLIEPEVLVRKVVRAFYHGESDQFIAKQVQNVMGMAGLPNPNEASAGRIMTSRAMGAAPPTAQMLTV